ncbi:MAG: leucine-rich repeat domain-containing protein, partial [Lachnospiraceae bacterium]|nr:leucine-rich repeat domain-containing protein [Lachnospiraceae bacterium]
IQNIMIPAVVTEIGSGAFRNCSGLKSVKVPDSVVSIGSGAFSGCSNLTEITLPFIGGNAEADKASGSTLFGYIFGTGAYPDSTAAKQNYSGSGTSIYYIPDALTHVTVTGGSILYGAFSGCGKLSDISITASESVTKIGDYAFSNCTGMKSFRIPEYVTVIGARAFGGCTGLKNVTIPDSVKSIGDYAFSGCTEIRDIALLQGLETIGSYAFQNCSSLTDITVPDTVMTINAAAFSGCSSLQKITLPFVGNSAGQTSASAKSLFGYIFGLGSYDGGTAVKQYYAGNSSNTYYIPSSLKTVVLTGGNLLYGAFYNCSNLTGITLPDNITDIGKYAFYNCTGITGIRIPSKVNSVSAYAFANCSGVQSITFSGSAPATIDAKAFAGDTATVYYP